MVPLSCKLTPVGSKGSLMLTMYLEQALYCRVENEHFPVSLKPFSMALNYRVQNPYLVYRLLFFSLLQTNPVPINSFGQDVSNTEIRLCCRRDRTYEPLGNGFKLFKSIMLLCKRSQVVMRWVKVSV